MDARTMMDVAREHGGLIKAHEAFLDGKLSIEDEFMCDQHIALAVAVARLSRRPPVAPFSFEDGDLPFDTDGRAGEFFETLCRAVRSLTGGANTPFAFTPHTGEPT